MPSSALLGKEQVFFVRHTDDTQEKVGQSTQARIRNDLAVTDIYNKYNIMLSRFLRIRLNCPEEQKDVSQEVFLRLMRDPILLDRNISLSFLCTIASNIIYDRFRRDQARHKNTHIPMDDFELKSAEMTPEDFMQSHQTFIKFRKIYKSMDKKNRLAFKLNRLDGLKYDEIAKQMGVSKRTVCYCISAAKQTFNRQLR